MDKKKNYTTCNVEVDKDNYKKDRTVCKSCYNIKKTIIQQKTLIQNQQPKIEKVNTNNNNRTLLVGPSFSVKTYFLSKILSPIPDRDNCIVTKSQPEENSDFKIKIKEYPIEIFIYSPNRLPDSTPILILKLKK